MARGRGRLRTGSTAFAILFTSILVFASATSVTIILSSRAGYAGVFVKGYYENQNAPVTGCSLPCLTVDTQTTQPNPSSGTLALDGSTTGTWSSGSSFPITASTTNTNDVIVIFVVTSLSSSSITVTGITDSLSKVSWQASARLSYISCTTAQELTHIEWYGIASSTITSDVITVQLSGTPTVASGVEFAVSGANTASPFDPNANVDLTQTRCNNNNFPAVNGISTSSPNDFIFALFGGYNSVTQTVGAIAGTTANAIQTLTGTGGSLSAEYRIVSATQSAVSCAFGTSSGKWGILCDAIIQASGSFSLTAGSNMYLWSPQYATAATIPAGSLSLQLFATLPAPALDGSTSGTWSSGSSFTIPSFTTAVTNDVVILSLTTYKSGTSVTVTSISDTQAKISWASSSRGVLVTCSGTQETTHIEWYGTTTSTISADTITVNLSTAPTAASGIAFGVSGADTTTPFDPAAGLPTSAPSGCTGTNSAPTVSGLKTLAYNDFVFTLFGGYTSLTETVGTIAVTTASPITTVAGTGDSNDAEYITATNPITSSSSCSFGTSTTYWGIFCDALLPARQTVTVSYVTTNSAGTVQSTMIAGSTATITAIYQPISLSSSAGSVPASGYVRVIITGPSGVALTIYWGYPNPTNFQVSYTYRA